MKIVGFESLPTVFRVFWPPKLPYSKILNGAVVVADLKVDFVVLTQVFAGYSINMSAWSHIVPWACDRVVILSILGTIRLCFSQPVQAMSILGMWESELHSCLKGLFSFSKAVLCVLKLWGHCYWNAHWFCTCSHSHPEFPFRLHIPILPLCIFWMVCMS